MPSRAPRKAPGFFRAAVGTVEIAADAGRDLPEQGKKAREFTMSVYSGGDMQMWFGKLAVDISGMEVPKGSFPSLVQHDPEKIAGFGESVDKGPKGQGPVTIKGKLLASSPHGVMVAAHSDEKFPWQASGGWRVSEYEEVEEDEEAEVNGRTFTGPGLIARKSFLAEGSWVPLGADGDTSAIAAASGDVPQIEVTRRKTKMGATYQELKAAFPKDVEFAIAQFEAGADLATAKAAYSDVLAKKLEEAETKAADAAKSAKAAADKQAASDLRRPVAIGGASSSGAGFQRAPQTAKQAFDELVLKSVDAAAAASKAERRTITPRAYVAREYPDVHAAFVNEANKGNPKASGQWEHMTMPTASGDLVRR